MRSPTSAPPEPSPKTPCGEAARSDRDRAAADADRPRPILAVERGKAERAFVPFENSIEGSVRSTLDTLAFETEAVTIVGEHDFAVRAHLIAVRRSSSSEIEAVLSHPQPLAQCARFLREQLPGVELRSVSSTAAAVRMVAESVRPWAAIGSRLRPSSTAARSCAGDRGRGRQRHPLRLDRPAGTEPKAARPGRRRWSSPSSARTTPGRSSTPCGSSPAGRSTSPGSSRGRCASGLGRYMFFCDLEGGEGDAGSRRRSRRSGPRPTRCGSSAPIPSAERGNSKSPAGRA